MANKALQRTRTSRAAELGRYAKEKNMKSIKRLFKWGLGLTFIPPMFGLVGTVIGMVQSFDSLGNKQGSEKAEVLAQSISFSLWTTAIGLGFSLIGIPPKFVLHGLSAKSKFLAISNQANE